MKENKKQIYIAGPLFTPGDRKYIEEIADICKKCRYHVYVPHRNAGIYKYRRRENGQIFFKNDLEAIDKSLLLIAILNGSDVDSGTAWEMGYAYAKNIKIIGMLEDTRKPSLDLLNPMITHCAETIVTDLKDLKKILTLIGGVFDD